LEQYNAKTAIGALMALVISQDSPQGYDANDLRNVAWILTTVMGEVLAGAYAELPIADRARVATEFGRRFRELVIFATKIDLHDSDEWPETLESEW